MIIKCSKEPGCQKGSSPGYQRRGCSAASAWLQAARHKGMISLLSLKGLKWPTPGAFTHSQKINNIYTYIYVHTDIDNNTGIKKAQHKANSSAVFNSA
jgi:hypothetical protein